MGEPIPAGHSCPWGGDCQDCGPRKLASIASEDTEDVAYGRPATSEYDAAVEFMCTSAEGFHCQGALVSKYTDFHGDRNVYTAAIRALCLDTSCALQNSVLKYALPHRSGVPCCFAAQVAVAHILEQAYGEHDLSPFAGVCSNDLGAEADFNLSCQTGSVPAAKPELFPSSQANAVLARLHGNCGADAPGHSAKSPVRFGPRSGLSCSISRWCRKRAGRRWNWSWRCAHCCHSQNMWLQRRLLGTGMACCEASGIIIADLLRQADRGRFDRDLCPTGCNGIVGKIDGMLGTAKSTLQSVATCATTTFAVFESVDTSGDVSKEQFKKYIKNDNICWLEWSLASVPIESVPTSGCEAADIVLAQHLRLYEPAIAPDVYEQAFNRSLDDEAVARALSAICNNAWGGALDARLKADAGSLFGDFSFQSKCENSCRCKTDFDGVEMPLVKVGCGLPPDNDEQEPTGSRPYCYVVDPASCTTSVASSIVGLDGESWTFCSVGYDTCQMYNGAEGPCAPFVPAGASIFVPAGATLESLQFLGEDIHGDSSANELLGLAGDGNWLSVWLLEAGLVSSDCYATHGRRVCDARLRRCENADQVPQPLPVCRADCAKAFSRSADASCNEVFSDTLRDIDGGVVCEWRLLPTGFSGLNGLQHGDGGEQLQEVLGIEMVLGSRLVSTDIAYFGQHVYPNEEDTTCFTSLDEAPGIDMAKALSLMSCPEHFTRNELLEAESSGTTGQFCLGSCPSNAYTDAQYSVLWGLFLAPGMAALLLNVGAWVLLVVGPKWGNASRNLARPATKKRDPTEILLLQLSSLAGAVGVLPVLARNDLICTCDTELCLRSDMLCKLNQASIYVVMAAVFCLLYKFARLLAKLRNITTGEVGDSRLDSWQALQSVWVVPLILAAVSFGLEDQGNERMHLARAGVRCQFRYASILDEMFLLHAPMAFCTIVMVYFAAANLKLCAGMLQQQHQARTLRNFWGVLTSKPQLKNMLTINLLSGICTLVWLSQAVVSWWVFENYVNSMDEWMQCIRYDYARSTALGAVWAETVSTYKDGESCPLFPDGVRLFELQLLKGIFETLLPGTVAVAIGWPIWRKTLPSFWQSKRKSTSVLPQNVALPHHGPSSGMI